MSIYPAIHEVLPGFARGRVCLLGFGNRMWRDDGVGSIVAEILHGQPGLFSIDGGMTPENYLEKVVQARPETVLLVDAADFGGAPGEIRLLGDENIGAGGLSTHAGSPKMLASYLAARTGARVGLLAIQPADTRAGTRLSPEVSSALKFLVKVMRAM